MTGILAFVAPDGGVPTALEAGAGTAAVTDHMRDLLAGWPPATAPAAGPAAGIAVAGRLEAEPPHRWRLHAPALEGGSALFDNPLAAANAAVGVLVAGLLLPRPDWLCLHAASLDLPGIGGIALVGDHMAGKSLFCAVAAAGGAGVLADDRTLLRLPAPHAGHPLLVALGVQPKLREPQPAALPRAAAAFIAESRGAAEGGMRFLRLAAGTGPGALRPFATQLPLQRLCFLERAADAPAEPARQERLGAAAAIARLIPYIYAPGRDAAGRLQAARLLVAAGTARVLRYRDCWAALDLLRMSATAERARC